MAAPLKVEEANRANTRATANTLATRRDVITYTDAGWLPGRGTLWVLGLTIVIALVVFVKFKIDQENQVRIQVSISQLKSQAPAIRFEAAKEADHLFTETNDSRLASALLEALHDRDEEVIAGAYPFFLREGRPGSEDELIEALNYREKVKSGSEEDLIGAVNRQVFEDMASAFLNSGNPKLEVAAREWASQHGFTIVQSTGESVHWGGAR
jgi:hypothetical protein